MSLYPVADSILALGRLEVRERAGMSHWNALQNNCTTPAPAISARRRPARHPLPALPARHSLIHPIPQKPQTSILRKAATLFHPPWWVPSTGAGTDHNIFPPIVFNRTINL